MMGRTCTFDVRQAANGWILSLYERARDMSEEYVFPTLDDMHAWLKAKYEPQQAA